MSDEKTEKPTDKKLRQVREEGKVTKSTDLVEAACIGATLVVFYAGADELCAVLQGLVHDALDFTGGDHSNATLLTALYKIGLSALGIMGAFCAVTLAAALLALVPQTGLQMSFEAVMPKLSAVSPSSGLAKIFSASALIDLLKMTVKGILIIVVMWQTIVSVLPLIAGAMYQSVPQLSSILWAVMLKILGVATGLFALIAVVDYKLQHWLFIRQNRMSKDEIKREHKESDGNPEVKGERKRMAKKLLSEPPRKNVARATVVVVNPTHYAVALRYVPAEFPLPIVVAKGLDHEALLLRRLATEANVPIVANPPVARKLYQVPENEAIPEELFEVVAAILRWVTSLATQRTYVE